MSGHDELSDAKRPRGRYASYTRARLKQRSDRMAQAIYPETAAAARIEIAGPTDRISFAEAQRLAYRDAAICEPLGPHWATWWVRVTARVPESWRGARVDLYWDSCSEGLLWLNGRSAQGLNPDRHTAILRDRANGGETLSFFVEVACNGMFGAGGSGKRQGLATYRLAACEIRRFDPEAWDLFHDFETLRQLEADREPPQTSRALGAVATRVIRPGLETAWAGRLLSDLNRVCNLDDNAAARKILAGLLSARNGSVAHELSAVGHAHLDTAWLWPIEETRRKAQRTFSTAVALMDRYSDFKFAVSQAYQYAVIEETDPDLFARIRAKVAAGQWIPIGGAWVEPDCNLPWGESLCRQFLYGQAYFKRTFGGRSSIFWNPDVFGYDGQLPQLMLQAGMSRFLTQKLSWNRFTSPPHHSFRWRGIDGSEVLTHFPPADTYSGAATIEELRYHAANYKDADRSSEALYLFGYGDGGGGADAGMIERLRRSADLLGVPRAAIRDPEAFFDRLAAVTPDLAIIEGELYFEYHRGVYTSQAEVKRLNRLCETRLQALEFLAVASRLAGRAAPTASEIEALWRTVLTNQFHDILPGTSIAEVYPRTRTELTNVAEAAKRMADELLGRLAGGDSVKTPINTLGFARAEVAETADGGLAYVIAAPFAAGKMVDPPDQVRLVEDAGSVRLENGQLSAILNADGLLRSLVHIETGREALAGFGGRILLLEDRPTAFDAWDIDPFALETARDAEPAQGWEVVSQGPLRAEARCERRLGAASRLVQTVRLDAGAAHLEFEALITWAERDTLVKVMFPLACRARSASYETMFGAVMRPTHTNTDADAAMYEVPGHRWADLTEPGFGVSLFSDARHGYSCLGNELALTLIRGPTWPDERADVGEHSMRYALFPHPGDWRAAGTVARATAFARPLLMAAGRPDAVLKRSLVEATPVGVVIDTIKPAEDGEGFVIRLYESFGAQASAHLAFGVPIREAWLSNTLEDLLSPLAIEAGTVVLALRPFQITTLRLK